MRSRIQSKDLRTPASSFASPKLAALVLLCAVGLFPARARAQDAPSGAIGRIEGDDISVTGGVPAGASTASEGRGIYVANGNTVTVHSGQALMRLVSGGEVDLCGPAKLTLLQSGGAIILALDFGRMHVHIPAGTELRIFTPTILGTPIDIGGGARDVTVGLDLDDSLCVLATSGALQLEHQFTGEKLIVPQTGEFFLNGGKLLPVAGKPGSCQCAAMQPRAMPPPASPAPEYGLTSRLETAEALQPQPSAAPVNGETAAEPEVEFSIPAHANEEHPVAPAAKNASTQSPGSAPVYTVIAPLTFSAGSPLPPPDPPIDMVLLVREAHLQPEWEFKGHVDAPAFAQAMQHALGEGQTPKQPPPEPAAKKRGFWGKLKRIFG